jgi:HD-GYP domain-containing protein (c-di-GMP phosphodiesterase class II)
MANDDLKIQSLVSIDELKEKMTIISYNGFHVKFKTTDEKTCQWLRHNFKNTSAQIERQGKSIKINIDQIKQGDNLQKLFNFPNELRKLTIVTDRLIKELRSRGFLRFYVSQPASSLSIDQQEIVKVNHLIQNLKKGAQQRDTGKKVIEELLDHARGGDLNTGEIVSFIKEISQDSAMDAVSAMVGLKESDQTYAHCIDVGAIFLTVYYDVMKKHNRKSIFKNNQEAMFASFLHDVGKSKVPKDILDSTVRFDRDSEEMKQMFNHPVYGKEILEQMKMPEYIINMAHYHHVKAETTMASSYPEVGSYDELIYETKLMSIIDVYQALVGKRSYKKSWTPPAAIRYIDTLAGVEYDIDAWDDFINIIGRYPIGSLVELSDHSIAFVVSVPEGDLYKPGVVRVKTAGGADIDDHSLLNLADSDLTIEKDLDSTEIFGTQGLEVFSGIQLI